MSDENAPTLHEVTQLQVRKFERHEVVLGSGLGECTMRE